MKKKNLGKLSLKKETLTHLDNGAQRQVQGGTGICAIVVVTTRCFVVSAGCYVTAGCATFGCATDFTRPSGG
jgi:hypothetical protein